MNKKRALAILSSNPFAYRDLWLHTIHVATTGNDTTGNGTLAAPYLTLSKAMTVAVAGDGIVIGDGTYNESTSGTNLWNITSNLADWLVIEPLRGRAGSVIITGNGSTTASILISSTTSHIHFRDLTFSVKAGSASGNLLYFYGASNNLRFTRCTITPINDTKNDVYRGGASTVCSDIEFIDCIFNKPASGAAHKTIELNESGTDDTKNWTFTNCTIHGLNYAAIFTRTGTGIVFSGCTIDSDSYAVYGNNMDSGTFTNCIVSSVASAYEFVAAAGAEIIISGGSATNTGTANTLQFTSAAFTVTISNLTVIHSTTNGGHAIILESGPTGTITNTTVTQCYDYALVLKEVTGVAVDGCDFTGGVSSASVGPLFYKAAVNCSIINSTLRAARGACLSVLYNVTTGNKCNGCDCTYTAFVVSGSGNAFQWGDSTQDVGGGICDYNTYDINGTGNYGNVYGTNNITTLAGVQAAWLAYDVTTNDANSTDV